MTLSLFPSQACKGEDLGKVEFDEEIKKRFKMVYVPNWFSVDLKTGVSHTHDRNWIQALFICLSAAVIQTYFPSLVSVTAPLLLSPDAHHHTG